VVASINRKQVLSFRVRAQQLDRPHGRLSDTAVLDIGVQDTGPDGGLWALANRGVDVSTVSAKDLATLWTIRGAPHLYRRRDVPAIATAVEPFSDEDAGKRIFDAAKPLKATGISNLAALDTVAAAMRSIVTKPMVKGEVSTRLTVMMDEPYLRYCRACQATHLYEMPFRLAALRAGLELQPGTSPPVLQRISGFRTSAKVPERFDVVRACLRLLGPATAKHVAEYLDAPLKDVKARWPSDTVSVLVDGETRSVLAADKDKLDGGRVEQVRLLGPFDLFLQARDRSLLVAKADRAKALWPVLGRPGAVLVNGDIVGIWRPRKSGARFAVQVQLWTRVPAASRDAIGEQAERLAAFRSVPLTTVDYAR
jgi:Winged helix DNA-binding domain